MDREMQADDIVGFIIGLLIIIPISFFGVWCVLPLPPIFYFSAGLLVLLLILMFRVGGCSLCAFMLVLGFIGAFLYGLWCIIFRSYLITEFQLWLFN